MRRIAAAILVSALCPAVAVAGEPTVHVDPKSPAGQEYAIPLDQGRNIGGGSTGSTGTLFGAGITPHSTATTSPAKSVSPRVTKAQPRAKARPKRQQKHSRAVARAAVVSTSTPAARPRVGGSSGTWILIALCAGIVAAGGLLGAGMSRTRS